MSRPAKSWPSYNPQKIEPKWQQLWERDGLHLAGQADERPKFYCLDFFPYPSGEGLHVGHCRNYVPTDVISRYRRMQGFNVLHPMGWDAFGEPAEQFAVAHGVHPRVTTDRNTANFRRQMMLVGAGYDWSREIDSSQPEFYRWTQYFFLLLYKRGLAYRDTNWQWWCPGCQTTLSSHEVSNGVCWRGHTGITRREIPAWYFRITAYADELVSGLDTIDWPENIKAIQRNWIGRSAGVEIRFLLVEPPVGEPHDAAEDAIRIFTTRADTLLGVSFCVLAPEHPLVERITTPERQAEVAAYVRVASAKSELERQAETRSKTGIFTGAYVLNPLNGERIPVWVADYVLLSYGTGAVMGVPAHDQRDFEFATAFNLPVKVVVTPPAGEVTPASGPDNGLAATYEGYGQLVNSGNFNGLAGAEAIAAITHALEARGDGRKTVNTRMRDWLISRQRYWGTPIPIIHCQACGEVPVPENQLPVLLPPMEDFSPDGSGRSPLARLPEFVKTTCPRCGGPARRETDTMGGFACSAWYFLRFTSPHYSHGPFEPDAMRYWMPVDLYVGGSEHAVLHLLYARFWTKVMADAGLVPFREPFSKLLNQGQMMGTDGKRMSKSRGNVITPDSMAETYGADALRLYVMFMAPFEQDTGWSTEGIRGARRFLNRLWSLYGEMWAKSAEATKHDPALARLLHRTIQQIGERIEGFRFNTLVSGLMEFTNALLDRQREGTWQTATFHNALETALVLLAPAVPHIAEELWQLTGHTGSVLRHDWPRWDARLAAEVELAQVAVQVDGRLRAVIEVALDAGQDEALSLALAHEKVQQYLVGRAVIKTIYVPGKILSLVTKE